MAFSPRILLINPPSNCVQDDRLEPPLGLLYLASCLRQKNYQNISVYDMTGSLSELEISNKIASICHADIYGICCFSTNYKYVKKIINHLQRNNPESYIILGGPHPTGMPDFTINDSNANAIVIGEGEDIFSDLISAFSKGLKPKGKFFGQSRKNIDSYSFPARDLVNFSTYSRKLAGKPVVSLLSSRGCIYQCIHCNSVIMGGGSKTVRYRSPNNVLKEINSLRDNFSFYRFNDDHFSGNPNLKDLLIKIKDFDVKFRIFARVEDLDNTTCKLLKEAGCVHVSIGLESLNQDNLRIIGKKRQVGKEANVKIAKDHGLVVRASFMVGLPFDNEQTIHTSFQKASELGLDEFAIYPLIPYPGTIVWKHPDKLGYTIINKNFEDYIQMGKKGKTCFALEHKNFTPEDVERWLHVASKLLESGDAMHMSKSEIAK